VSAVVAAMETQTPHRQAGLGVSRMARGGLANALGAAVAAAGSIGVVLAVTNSLEPTEAGLFFSLTSLILIVSVVSRLGTPTGLVYFLSTGRAVGPAGQERRVLSLALRPVALLSLVLAAALFAGAPRLLSAIGVQDAGGAAADQLRVLAPFVPVLVLSEVYLSATRGLGGMRSTVLIDRVGRSGLQLLLVLAAAPTRSPVLVALAWSLPYLPATLLAWRDFLRSSQPRRRASSDDASLTPRTFWRFTAPRSVASVVQIALQRVDILVVAGILGPAPAALYTASSRFLVLGQMGGQAVSLAAQPLLGRAMATGRHDEARDLYRTATAWLVLMCWPVYLTCILFADRMLSLFGPEYVAGRDVVLVLGLAMLLATGCGMVDVVLIMAGRTSWNLVNNVLALAINVVVDVLLIPRIGIMGAAVGWAAAIAVNNLLPLAELAASLRIHPFGRATTVAMGLSSVGFGALPLLGRVVAGDDRGMLAGLGLGVMLFLSGCFLERRALALSTLLSAARRPTKEKS
jgi:O-antigen/teichoic acid export membrane protein